MIGRFKLRYPHVHNMADAGEILAGPIGREVFGASQVIFITFACASHVLAGMIAFETRTWSVLRIRSFLALTATLSVTSGSSCSVVWSVVTAAICFVLTIPRTLDGISYLSVVSFTSVIGTFGLSGHRNNFEWLLL